MLLYSLSPLLSLLISFSPSLLLSLVYTSPLPFPFSQPHTTSSYSVSLHSILLYSISHHSISSLPLLLFHSILIILLYQAESLAVKVDDDTDTDKSVSNMKAVLASMLDKLQTKIDSTEKVRPYVCMSSYSHAPNLKSLYCLDCKVNFVFFKFCFLFVLLLFFLLDSFFNIVCLNLKYFRTLN